MPSSEPSPLAITADLNDIQLTREDTGAIVFEFFLTFHFVNQSSKPILLFVKDGVPAQSFPYPLPIAQTLSGSQEEASAYRFLHVSSALPASDKPAWEDTGKRLDHATPPPDLIRIIEPGKSLDRATAVHIFIDKEGSLDKSSKPWDLIRKSDPLWLQISFQMWPNNLESDMRDPKFGRRLQKKWKGQGQLILQDHKSIPIPVSLPTK
jgi:hypothetical protein